VKTPVTIPYVNLAAHNAALKSELLAAVARVIDHGQFINGPEVAQLESALATWLGVPHVIGVSNGTDALVLGLRLAGVGPGDEVICPSHSFVATATAIRLVGATPVFADLDEATMNLDVASTEAAITPRTRAVMPVHLNGFPADLTALSNLCQSHGLQLVEDCAQAVGARHHGQSVGTLGIGCFSLHPLKVLSAIGDAGFITVPTAEQAARLKQMRNLGLVDRDHCAHPDPNNRMDTVHAAMLLAKLPHLPEWVAARQAHAAAYRTALKDTVTLPPEDGPHRQVYSAFVVRHPKREALIAHLATRGIDAKIHYPIPIHRQEAFRAFATRELPVTDRVCETIVSLPVTPELSVAQRGEVISAVLEFAKKAA
jgi:dTDP-4-amino-4,6-dideoxygalactose transaminase